MNKNEEQVLRDLLIDIDVFKKLSPWIENNVNLFEILGVTNTEIRHSNILAWLFDSNANHDLGDRFIKFFFQILCSKYYNDNDVAFDLLLQDFSSFYVKRESNNMDIVLNSYQEKVLMIIENKIWSNESSHQLGKYFESSKQLYPGYKHYIYIFLTPDGRDPYKKEDKEHWLPFSYEDIIDVIDKTIDGITLKEEIKLIIDNYKHIIRSRIMQEKDQRLVQLCNEIYNKHKDAFKLIFENVELNSSIESEAICNTLKDISATDKIIYNDNNGWHFFTKEMNDVLPNLDTESSSWGTKWIYWYWFSMHENKLIIHFELGGWGISTNIKGKMRKIIEVSNKKYREDFRYCRTFQNKHILKEDYTEDDIVIAVKELVNSALEYQKNILKQIK